MNDLVIKERCPKSEKVTSLIAGGYFALFGLYLCIVEALAHRYSILFYVSLAGIILGAILILLHTLWQTPPQLTINNETVVAKFADQKNIPAIEWSNIQSIAIGVSYIKITTTKEYSIDLQSLKYADLKTVKSKIIEICEAKSITYHNG